MSLLIKLSRSLVTSRTPVTITARRRRVTIPMSVRKPQNDPCLYCNGKGRSKCLECSGRGIIIEDGKEYRCSSCSCSGWETCAFCSGDRESYRIF